MGFSPIEVDQMSYWQLLAVSDGWAEAHTPAKSGMGEAEAEEMFEWLQTMPPVPLSHNRAPNGKIWNG